MKKCKSPQEYFLQYLKEYCPFIYPDYSKGDNALALSYAGFISRQVLTPAGIKVDGHIFRYFSEFDEIESLIDQGLKNNDWSSIGLTPDQPSKKWWDYFQELEEMWKEDCKKCPSYRCCQMNFIGYSCVGLGGKYIDAGFHDDNTYDWEVSNGNKYEPLK